MSKRIVNPLVIAGPPILEERDEEGEVTVQGYRGGTLQHYGSSLPNTEDSPFDLQQVSYRISNEPVIIDGQLVFVPERELVKMYTGKDTTDEGTDLTDKEVRKWTNTQLIEYRTNMVISVGDCDVADPEEALAHPRLGHVGDRVTKHIKAGSMDVLMIKRNAPETGSKVSEKGKEMRIRRDKTRECNLWLIRRVFDFNALGDDKCIELDKDHRERGFRFVALTGQVVTKGNDRTTRIKAVVYGRMPADGYKPSNKNSHLFARGRGWLFVFDVAYVDWLRASYFEDLQGLHAQWLKTHPTPARFVGNLRPAQAPSKPLTATVGELAGLAPAAPAAQATPTASAAAEAVA
jgi:hypothetical protein